MIVYIAGKMTGLPDNGRENFTKAEMKLTARGFTVLNPAVLPDSLSSASYMPICMAMLDAADAIYMLRNWRDSDGAKLEYYYAKYQNKAVMLEENDE